MKYPLIVFLALAVCLTSCIGTKRLTYLQENNQKIDSVMSVHRMHKPYRVQVNDLLSIEVKTADPELTQMFKPSAESSGGRNQTSAQSLYYNGFLVDAHGDIRVPTLGKMNVLGFTVEEIRKKIEEKLLSKFFKNEDDVFVTVKLAGIRYTTIGEIGSGSQIIYKNQVTIMEAIANAGGIDLLGDRTDVVVLRKYPGGDKIHHIDLTSSDATNSPYYYIQPNDLIIVKPLPQKSLGFGTTGLKTFTALASVVTLLTSLILLATN